ARARRPHKNELFVRSPKPCGAVVSRYQAAPPLCHISYHGVAHARRLLYFLSMIRKNPSGDLPVIAVTAFVDPTAILCGKVIVEDFVFIGPYAVIRADETDEAGNMEPIVIGERSNIQDGVVIHSKDGAAVIVGKRVSIAHRAIVH